MIQTKEDLRLYLEKDKQALGITRKRPCLVGDDIWKFEIALRYHEYLVNVNGGGVTRLIRRKFWGFLHHYFGIRLGFTIPVNVFDYGLRINHYGTIVGVPARKIKDTGDPYHRV